MYLWKQISLFWTFVIIALTANHVKCLRILGIFPMNGKSHSIIQLSIMKALAEKGHQVDVYSHFPSKTPIPNYTDYSLAGYSIEFKNNMSYEVMSEFKNSANIARLINLAGNPNCEMLSKPVFQKLFKNPPKYDVVIT